VLVLQEIRDLLAGRGSRPSDTTDQSPTDQSPTPPAV
jgi:hypothetical protein